MKSLKPSLRNKKRYIMIKGENLKENIEKSILEFIGILGMSKTSLKFVQITPKRAIICVNRKMLDSVKASFAVYKELLTIERVSGSLKGLRKK
jgi:RNase P/RNase MRP subunit POP5